MPLSSEYINSHDNPSGVIGQKKINLGSQLQYSPLDLGNQFLSSPSNQPFAFRDFASQMEKSQQHPFQKLGSQARGPPPGFEQQPSWMNAPKNSSSDCKLSRNISGDIPNSHLSHDHPLPHNSMLDAPWLSGMPHRDGLPNKMTPEQQQMFMGQLSKSPGFNPSMMPNPFAAMNQANPGMMSRDVAAMMPMYNNAMMMFSMAPMMMMMQQQFQQQMQANGNDGANTGSLIESMMSGAAQMPNSLIDSNHFSTPNTDSPYNSDKSSRTSSSNRYGSLSPTDKKGKNENKIDEEVNCTVEQVDRLSLNMSVNPSKQYTPTRGKYFIIKSFTEDDVHRAVKYKVWCSTYYGNRRLEAAWDNFQSEAKGRSVKQAGEVILFFSVNASGHFCGVAKMEARPDPDMNKNDIWTKDEHNEGGDNSKWRGGFKISWIYVKDIPNNEFAQLKVAKNGGKPFPHSRDTQEVDRSNGEAAMKIFHRYQHKTSLLDDFDHYNRMEEKQRSKEKEASYKHGRKDNHGRYNSRNKPIQKKPISIPKLREEHQISNTDTGYVEEVPGVMEKLKKSTVEHLRKAQNCEKNQEDIASPAQSTGSVPDDSVGNVEERIRKPGMPGPNAIKIVKPPAEEEEVVDDAPAE